MEVDKYEDAKYRRAHPATDQQTKGATGHAGAGGIDPGNISGGRTFY